MELVLFNLGILYIYIWFFFLCFNNQMRGIEIRDLSLLIFLILGGAFTVFLYTMFDSIIGVSFK